MLGIHKSETAAIISSQWDRIAKATNPVWLPQDILGCGSYGCVYSTSDPNVVCKVSTDPTEYMFINLAIRLGEWPDGIVRYYQTLELPVKHEHGDAFVVWRESAFDVGEVLSTYNRDEDVSAFERYQIERFEFNLDVFLSATDAIRKILRNSHYDPINMVKSVNHRTEHMDYFHQLFPDKPTINLDDLDELIETDPIELERLSFCLQLARFIIGRMHDDPMSYHIAKALDFYMRRGITFADIHSDNIGKVNRAGLGTIVVITDPGHAVLLSDGQVL